jgi:cation diffusion facilitator family transporter
MNKKVRVALLSVASNTVLTSGKLAAGLTMGSVSVLSEGFHSGVDLLASLIAFYSIRQSGKPADKRHPFGHGKFENIAGITEALLILIAAGVIVWRAGLKILHPTPVEALGLGAFVMGISAGVNLVVSNVLLKTAKETDSPALEADGWHLRTDVYTSLGVFFGIGAIHLTGLIIIDPLIGTAIALLIARVAFKLIRESLQSILDVSIPAEEEAIVKQVLDRFKNEYVEYHALRTRRAGAERHVDLHLVLPPDTTVAQGDALVNRIKDTVEDRLPRTFMLISTEPCRADCAECAQACNHPETSEPQKRIKN